MSHQNKLKQELADLQAKRKEMRTDLISHTDLSNWSQRVIRIELSSLDQDICNLRKEIEDMEFEDMMHRAWNGEDDGV